MNNKDVQDLSFKEGMRELEALVAKLESGSLELEDSLAQYEEGVKLLAHLRTKLTSAQQKVDTLMGELSLIDDDVIDSSLHKA